MTAKFIEDVMAELTLVAQAAPNSIEFEMAYQARVACDRIRFAIKSVEALSSGAVACTEPCLQLLDALQRLENVERRVQRRSACRGGTANDPE
jgi:hypothetical protein